MEVTQDQTKNPEIINNQPAPTLGASEQKNPEKAQQKTQKNQPKGQPKPQIYTLTPQNLKAEIKANHHLEGVVGGRNTFAAFKSNSSYLITTFNKGLILVEDNQVIYHGRISKTFNDVTNAIYVDRYDCYFLCVHSAIYKKEIDDKPAFLWIKTFTGCWICRSPLYNRGLNRLVLDKDFNSLCLANIEERKIEVEIKKDFGADLRDYRLLGDYDHRAIGVTQDGFAILYDFNRRRISDKLDFKKIGMCSSEDVTARIAVCEGVDLACIATENKGSMCLGKLIMLKASLGRLMVLSSVDVSYLGLRSVEAFSFNRVLGESVVSFVLLGTSTFASQVAEFGFDFEKRVFLEATADDFDYKEQQVKKLSKVGQGFLYTGENGLIVEFSSGLKL